MQTIIPTWLDSFYGDSLTVEEYECKTLSKFTPSQRMLESRLYKRKWFDYRRLHPLQATYYFVEVYKKRFKLFTERYISLGRSKFVRGIRSTDFLNSREALTFWKLRQLVDWLGIEYESFFIWAEAYMASMSVAHKYYPRPPYFMFSSYENGKDLLVALREDFYNSPEIHFAKDPFYTPERYIGHPDQIAYENYIVGKIKFKKDRQEDILSSALYAKNALRIEKAMQEFPSKIVREAVNSPFLIS